LFQQRRILNGPEQFDRALYIPETRASNNESYLQRPSANDFVLGRTRPTSYYSRADATQGSSYLAPDRRTALYSHQRSRSESRPHEPEYTSYGRTSYARGTFRPPDRPQIYDVSKLDPTDPRGVQGLFIQESQAVIDRKIRAFKEMNIRASELETWVSDFDS